MIRTSPFIPYLPPTSDAEKGLEKAFPRTHARRELHSSAEVVGYSWPLPGASAAKAKVNPAAKVKSAASSAQKKIALSRIFRHKERSISRRKKEERKYRLNNAARNAIAVPGAAQGNHHASDGTAKESMTSYGTYSSYVGKKNKLAKIDREEVEKKSNSTENSQPSHRFLAHGKNFSGLQSDLTIEQTTDVPENKSDLVTPTNETIAPPLQEEKFSCLYVTDVQECYEYMRLMRDRKENNYFCLNSSLFSMFDHLFHDAVHKKSTVPREIVFSHVNRHDDQEITQFNNLRGMPDITFKQEENHRIISKNEADSILSLLTLSVISNEDIKRRNISTRFVIPENTFKLFKSPAPSGTGGYFIAYHINKCREHSGFNAGIIPVNIFDNFIMLEDQATGLMLSGDSVNNFIDGLSKVTGLKYYYNDNIHRPQSDLGVKENYLIKTQSLFINQNATMKGFCSLDDINEELTFFSPVRNVRQENNMSIPLYRNSFTLSEGSLIYINEKGEEGAFRISATGKNSSYYSLSPQLLGDARHYSQAGFLHGQNYTRQMLIEQLQAKGMNYLSFNNDIDFSAKLDGFYMDIELSSEEQPMQENTTETEVTTTEPDLSITYNKCLSRCFSFQHGLLQYYDDNGEYDEVFFTPQQSGLLKIDYDLSITQSVFLQEVNIKPGVHYNASEIHTRLESANFINYQNMALSE
ncbi:hypothetical protein [Pantoea sp. A4]|uniref:hypothetical protein n=1 Tax=Pantoea sp. A4 TaxID=1225184 RepID=UPI0003690B7F|nr:hypothetical protein [Pantoea sp. A4]